tara:strand:- start:32918 stop:33385 length:468 start_codon:yes stop_codon:yes gene_type:complete
VGNKEWTAVIKSELCRVGGGNPFGYRVAASGVTKKDYGEWLYDVVWLDYAEGDTRQLLSVPFVAESEWGNDGDINDDFEKLLVARADVRLMIFGEANPDNDATVERLKSYVNGFSGTQKGDVYLLAMYENREAWFRYCRIDVGISAEWLDPPTIG